MLVCCPGIHDCIRDNGTNRDATGGGPGLRINWVRRIVGNKRVDKRRMDELRGLKEHFKKKLMRNCLGWPCGKNGI